MGAVRGPRLRSRRIATLSLKLAGEPDKVVQLDTELRRVADSADALVRAAQDLRAVLDALADDVRELARDAPGAEPGAGGSSVDDALGRPGGGEDDGEAPEGARLVALDMVLDGRSREEVAERLRAEFELADPEPLLDEVYARVER